MPEPNEYPSSSLSGSIGYEEPKIYAALVPRDEVAAHLEAGTELTYIERFDTRDDSQANRGLSQMGRATHGQSRHFTPEDFRLLNKDKDIVVLSATPTEYDAYKINVEPLVEAVRKERAEREKVTARNLEAARNNIDVTAERQRP